MPRDLILGTAGHIDHGKTSLVKALTGVDCDRLPEEKERGITIDIGFASLDLGDFRLGIVDVPGHERFIKNMLAGATGIDLAVLVIAADDSIMPQTREHLEILRLLGLKQGVIALTKADLVDETTLEVVEMEIRDLVQGSFLADAPIVRTSAITGMGLEQLKSAIARACQLSVVRGPLQKPTDNGQRTTDKEWFRLAIDRSFIVQGHGTVVTGSVTSGSVRVGDELAWLPKGETVRVRSLHNHDRAVEEIHRGQRAAINLAGVSLDAVERGQELATPGYLIPSRTITVRLHALAESRRPLKHRTEVRLHIGTAEVMATLSLLDCDSLQPGQWGLAQLFLEGPISAIWGQPFVLRESSAVHTLGGGQILQPVARKIRRRHLEILERVELLWNGTTETRALAVAWFTAYAGVTVADLVRGGGFSPDVAVEMIAQLREAGKLIEVSLGHARTRLLHVERLDDLDQKIQNALGELHAQFPLMTSHDRQKVQSLLSYVEDDALVHAAVDRLIGRKIVIGDLRRIARADFKPKLSANLRKLKDKLVLAYREGQFTPPDPESFAGVAGGNAANLRDLFEVCIAEGYLVRIAPEIYLHSDIEAEMTKRVKEKLSQGGPGLTVAEIRDLLGTTRKYAIPLCEYLDRSGVTQREGDLRVLKVV